MELPAMEMRQQASSSRVNQRRYSYHQGPSHMPPSGSFNHGRPPAMPYTHTAAAAARQFADDVASSAAYGSSWSSRQHSSHFTAVLPSVPNVPDCSSSVPADYGSKEFLLDEQVQAMLVDVVSSVCNDVAAPAPAPARTAATEMKLQQQRNMMRRADGLSRQISADASYDRLPGMPKAAPAPASAGGSFDSAADAVAALNSYMMRHEQQKQRHQQCISAAAAAAALNASNSGGSSPAGANNNVGYNSSVPAGGMSGGVSGLVGLAGAVGLSKQAQVKLQELMAAQQMQLEIQMELLQLLSAA
jgi:hypothetical protein